MDMSKETRSVKLWQIGSSAKAYHFSTFAKNDLSARQLWIPRSVISHVSWLTGPDEERGQECLVEIEEWFCEKEDL